MTWRAGLDLYPIQAAVLRICMAARRHKAPGAEFRWNWRSVWLVVLVGLGPGLPPLLFCAHPMLASHLKYGHVSGASVDLVKGFVNNSLWRALEDMPMMTAIVEELVFRSYLFVTASTTRRAILINAVVCTVWNLVSGFKTAQATACCHSPVMLLI